VNVREDVVTDRVNEWIGSLFAPQNRDTTVRALAVSQGDPTATARDDAARQQLAEAEATLRRFQEAIAAGVDPAAVVEPINRDAPNGTPRARAWRTPNSNPSCTPRRKSGPWSTNSATSERPSVMPVPTGSPSSTGSWTSACATSRRSSVGQPR
jgi:hypothetical protein